MMNGRLEPVMHRVRSNLMRSNLMRSSQNLANLFLAMIGWVLWQSPSSHHRKR